MNNKDFLNKYYVISTSGFIVMQQVVWALYISTFVCVLVHMQMPVLAEGKQEVA